MGSFLRNLTPDQQVSLVFVVLFGLLLIASGVGVLLSLRERRAADEDATGVRALFLGPSESWLTNGTADWFWPAAERARLPVMVLAASGAEAFAKVAERHPQLPLIVDHMGLTVGAVRAGRVMEVVEQVERLARFANVSVKLSAAPNLSTQPYPFVDFRDPIRRLFNAYGPQRCYWGTDLTNGFARATYRQRVTHFTEALEFLSESDKHWVMGRALQARLNWA